MTLTEFLLARITEDEAVANSVSWGHPLGAPPLLMTHGTLHINPSRVRADCDAKRRIIELHRDWPMLVERQQPGEAITSGDPSEMVFQMSRQIAWMTEQKYREAFGDEPPTGPILAALALPYADHPDYDETWRP